VGAIVTNRDEYGRFVNGNGGGPGRPSKHQGLNAYQIRRLQTLGQYGMSLDDYGALWEAQDGRCAICEKRETKRLNGRLTPLAVDHSHSTGIVRGLLCYACNTGIGKLGEDYRILERAAEYLKSAPDSR